MDLLINKNPSEWTVGVIGTSSNAVCRYRCIFQLQVGIDNSRGGEVINPLPHGSWLQSWSKMKRFISLVMWTYDVTYTLKCLSCTRKSRMLGIPPHDGPVTSAAVSVSQQVTGLLEHFIVVSTRSQIGKMPSAPSIGWKVVALSGACDVPRV